MFRKTLLCKKTQIRNPTSNKNCSKEPSCAESMKTEGKAQKEQWGRNPTFLCCLYAQYSHVPCGTEVLLPEAAQKPCPGFARTQDLQGHRDTGCDADVQPVNEWQT